MDIIGTILARNGINELKASGGVGYTTQQTASFIIPAPDDATPDVSLMGFNFKWFSGLTPTQEEFLAGTWIMSKDGESVSYPISHAILNTSVVATANGAYCVNMDGNLYVVSTVLKNELGTLPKTGIYYSTTLSNDEYAGWTHIFVFDEKVHPIDPKYIPGAVLPVVEIADIDNITGAENEKLRACMGLPCIIKFGGDGEIVSALYSYLAVDSEHMFANDTFTFMSNDDGITWRYVPFE